MQTKQTRTEQEDKYNKDRDGFRWRFWPAVIAAATKSRAGASLGDAHSITH